MSNARGPSGGLPPVAQGVVEDNYVEIYEQSHFEDNLNYKVAYRDYFTIDALLSAPYTALIVGCGTLGAPLHLLKGAGRIVGVDRSAKMLDAARRLSQRAKNKDVGLVRCDIVSFPEQCREQFDFVELGLMGTYLPFNVAVVESYARLLRPGGLLLLASAIVPPTGLRPEGTSTRIRCIVSSALSTCLFALTGKTTYRTSISLRAITSAIERWATADNRCEITLIYHEARKNGWEHPVAYRALLQKSDTKMRGT